MTRRSLFTLLSVVGGLLYWNLVCISRDPRQQMNVEIDPIPMYMDPLHGVMDVTPRAPIQLNNPPRCQYQDGSTLSGTCVFDEEFNGTTLDPAKWIINQEWFGPLNASVIPEDTCITAVGVSVGGGVLSMPMAPLNLTSCPQTWTTDAHYNSLYSAQWPVGHPTHWTGSVINQKTGHGTFGHVQYRLWSSAGQGPGTDISMWGSNCQGPNGVLAPLITGIFTTESTPCKWPASGSQEMDFINYVHGNGIYNTSMYVAPGSGIPPVGTFFGINYSGTLWSNSVGVGKLFLAGNPTINPSDGFHIYDVYWLPVGPSGAGQWMFFIDGTMLAIEYPTWIASTPMFIMLWNQDALTMVNLLPQATAQWDYIRWVCPVGYTCPYTN